MNHFLSEIYLERQKSLLNSLFLTASQCSALRPNPAMISHDDLTCDVLDEQSMSAAIGSCINYELLGLIGYGREVNCSQMEYVVQECGVDIAKKY